ncbi:2-phospho-L-lactate guanylyltransferase [Cryobacterium sp. TMT1-21]|uniref:Phosphoenolpyruvate guanylyltransferase n=1 Tax=Cryobacterium shii TaxID=1259235 RepID=A0AAQ2C6U0_9MICO|nr:MULTISPECIES: 2-phospho-L-lactate guanylyltransferase [Cryobacterium]TFC47379.1 2-phospho-L-lactate guanylyltransferase [Cryobacterium shii]TFC89313.1 2-phospho-L-lactate guanylyltransferase [Cryobacterium sp. TmT2-59]TFD07396.1 2-phospho-L-lactate guanylyltransferase [Cryobacterium sp. TMT1-21]TFD12492.1 2-phospho-L-lactate guanylyltransferase [Cryobacterium sp. TMT4-10]TFD17452.1 2-phospho-L-lactate guanylyltransferase [Cryobacterium sp. TMT2-23]
MSWVAVVPVKGNPGAKTRLGARPDRARLADAFALDTVGALLAAPGIDRVIVVTGDGELAGRLAALGADIVRESRHDPVPPERAAAPTDPLNTAIRQGLAVVRAEFPHANVAVLTGDLPALTPAEVERALTLAAAQERSMVPDAAGTGTTTLLARAGTPIEPRFGVGSRAAHEAAGHIPLELPASAGIRRDVDTTADLLAVARLGLGPHTSPLVDGARGPGR